MKIRTDFVTNSSSSSFIISKKHLDSDQIKAIHCHVELGKHLKIGDGDPYDRWSIRENEEFITGDTYMDNFDMSAFLKEIAVDMRHVHWGEYPFNLCRNTSRYEGINRSRYPELQEEEKETDWRDLL